MNISLNPLPLWDTNLAKDLNMCLSPFLLVKHLQHWSWWDWTLFIKLDMSVDKELDNLTEALGNPVLSVCAADRAWW